jgi:hypothetical protein
VLLDQNIWSTGESGISDGALQQIPGIRNRTAADEASDSPFAEASDANGQDADAVEEERAAAKESFHQRRE